MKWWKRLGVLLVAAVLILGLCQVPGGEVEAATPYTLKNITFTKTSFKDETGQYTLELADKDPVVIDEKNNIIYIVYKSIPERPTSGIITFYCEDGVILDVVDNPDLTEAYYFQIDVKAQGQAGDPYDVTVAVKKKKYADNNFKVISEKEREDLNTGGDSFEGTYPQITSFEVLPGYKVGEVSTDGATVSITQNDLTPEELAQNDTLDAGSINITLANNIDAISQVRMESMYYNVNSGCPDTYQSASVQKKDLIWDSDKHDEVYLDLLAKKKDGSDQTFRYRVNLNIVGFLRINAEKLLEIEGMKSTYMQERKDDAESGHIQLIMTRYQDGKVTVSPYYAAGAFCTDVTGGALQKDGKIKAENLNRGLSFTIQNAMGKQKTYSIQVNTPWALQWTDSVNPQIKKILKNGTEQTKGLVKQGKWSADILEENSTVEVQLTPPETGQVLDTVVLKTSGGQAVDVTRKNGSFSFTMPNDVVTIESLQWKKGTYYMVTTSAEDKAGETINSKYETATIQVNETADTMAAAGDTVAVTPTPGETHPYYQYELDHWDYDKPVLKDAKTDPITGVLTFTMPEKKVAVKAVYKKVGTEMTFRLIGPEGGSLTAGGYRLEEGGTLKVTDTYRQGAELTLRLFFKNTTGYRFDGWKNASGVIWDENDSSATWTDASTAGIPYREPTITVGTEPQTWVAEFKAKAFGSVTLSSEDENKGTVTGTYKGTPGTTFGTVFEGEEVSLKAAAKDGYLFDHWTVVDEDDNPRTVLDGKGAEVTLTREAGDDKNLTITAVFKVDPDYKSPLCDITDVELLDKEGKVVRGMTAQEGTTLTIGLTKTDMSAEDAEGLNQDGKYFLKITHSAKSTVAHRTLDDANPSYPELAWNKGNVTCPIAVNSLGEQFVVTADKGNKKTYTIKITYESEKPVISDVSVERTSDSEAKVTFTSDTKGNYFYLYKKAKDEAPTQDEVLASKLKGSIGAGSSQTLNLKALNDTAYKVYLVVKGNMNGSMPSDVTEIDVPKLGSYTISNVCSTSGGTVTIDKKRADAGEKITVTVTANAGMKLDSLIYTKDNAAGMAPVSILDGKVSDGVYTFEMPTANITVGCTWSKASETDGPIISAFQINGVSGTVSHTAGTIKITLPYGTDLTSLKPEITVKNAKSVSPASGAAVNLTAPVTYTVAAEDGTTKTYTVTATVADKSLSDKLWEDVLNQTGGSTDSSGKNTWWNKARDMKKNNNYPKYW